MNNLFNIDTRLYRIMSRLSQFIGLNLITFLCCIPIVTMGAAFSACHKVTHDIMCEGEDAVIKPFFRAFRQSFKQATLVWIVYILVIFATLFNIMMIDLSFTGSLRIVTYVIVLLMLLIFSAISAVLFPLIGRYQNTIKEHLSNSAILTLCHPLRAIAMALLNAFPFLLAYVMLLVFLKYLVVWMIFGISVIFLLDYLMMKKIYDQMDAA